jgi:hypothetical protein
MLAEMQRRREEADYVLENLRRARDEVLAHPEWFAPVALKRIDDAIVYVQEARGTAHRLVELDSQPR